MRALLIDDNTFDAFMIGRALNSWDVAHDLCTTVAQALEKLHTSRYDVVLVSARLTNGDPYAAGRTIASAASVAGSAVPMVLLSAAASGAAAISPGDVYVDVLPKPLDPSVLYAKLASVRE